MRSEGYGTWFVSVCVCVGGIAWKNARTLRLSVAQLFPEMVPRSLLLLRVVLTGPNLQQQGDLPVSPSMQLSRPTPKSSVFNDLAHARTCRKLG